MKAGGSEARRDERRRRLVRQLRAAVMATAAVVLCWPLTVAWGVAAAALGAVAGAVWGDHAARSSLRLASALTMAALSFAAGLLLARGLVSSVLVASVIGPVTALVLGEVLLWGVITSCFAFTLRLLAVRRPTLAILEVVAVAAATAAGFAAHRQGMVHRPLEIGDWAWSRGLDPALVFLVLGGLGTLLLAALMVRETRRRRLPLHFASLIAIAFLMIFFVRVEGLPQPDPAGDLGLTGDPEEAQEEQGEEGGQGGQGDRHELGDLEFRDDYGNSGQQAPVAVVVLHDDYTPPTGIYYFRQAAFSQYNGHRLVQSTRDDVDLDIVRRFPFEEITVKNAPELGRDRRALITTMGLMVDHVRPFALDSPARLMPAPNPNPMRFRRTFKVRSHVPVERYEQLLGRRPGNAAWNDEQWRHYTRAPADPRYAELAFELMGYLVDQYREDPLGQALAIKTYLDKEGIYSRQSRHAEAADPAASFLFGDMTGYCVHFAHAATYLLRSLGLPARVAAGYAVSESDRAGGSALLIRGGNAHAWPEVYLEGAGWVVVDLMPEQSLDEPMASPDRRLQQMLGEMMRQGPDEDDFADQLSQAFDWQQLLRRLGLLLAGLLTLAYLIKAWRRLAPRFAPRALHRLGYRATLDRLAEVGLLRRFGESREGFARRAAGAVPSLAPLTDAHLGHALGSRRLAGPQELEITLQSVREEIRTAVPLWRRLLGALDPIAWLRVR